jgi:hypothetical protein
VVCNKVRDVSLLTLVIVEVKEERLVNQNPLITGVQRMFSTLSLFLPFSKLLDIHKMFMQRETSSLSLRVGNLLHLSTSIKARYSSSPATNEGISTFAGYPPPSKCADSCNYQLVEECQLNAILFSLLEEVRINLFMLNCGSALL